MTDYERMAKQIDEFADFLAAHFRSIRFVPARCDVEGVMTQYAILIQRHDGMIDEITQRLNSRGMSTYDRETADREQ